jgi:hypothetical protein
MNMLLAEGGEVIWEVKRGRSDANEPFVDLSSSVRFRILISGHNRD